METDERPLLDSLLIEVLVTTFSELPVSFVIPASTVSARACVLYLEDAYIQMTRTDPTIFYPELKLVSPQAAQCYRTEADEHQNVLGRLITEVTDGKFGILRHDDRGPQDTSEFTPVDNFSFRVLMDEKPFLPTLTSPGVYTFVRNGNTFTCSPLTLLLRLNYYP